MTAHVRGLMVMCDRALFESEVRARSYLRGGLAGWWMRVTLPLRRMPIQAAPVAIRASASVKPPPVQTSETPLETGRRVTIERRRAAAAANVARTSEILADNPRISDEALAQALGVSQSTANRYKRAVRRGER